MTPPVTLRPIRAADAAALAALASSAGSPARNGIVAVQGDAVIGLASWRDAELCDIRVAAEAPRLGVGTTLLAAAEYALCEAGIAEAWLLCPADNAPARRFFERHGWQVTGTEAAPRHLTDAAEAWRMTKAL
jgi:ribosomal protein S18 acetylase RimI-like enzyme